MDFPGKRTKKRWIFHDVVGLLKGIIQIIEELGSQKLEAHSIPWWISVGIYWCVLTTGSVW